MTVALHVRDDMIEDDKTRRVLIAFGRRLAELRRERGWSTADLAARSGLKLDSLTQFEGGEVSASLDDIRRLAGAFGVPLSELVDFADPTAT